MWKTLRGAPGYRWGGKWQEALTPAIQQVTPPSISNMPLIPSVPQTPYPGQGSPKIAPFAADASAPKISINIENRSGTPVSMSGEAPYFDGKQWVMNMVLEAIDTVPGFRNALGVT